MLQYSYPKRKEVAMDKRTLLATLAAVAKLVSALLTLLAKLIK